MRTKIERILEKHDVVADTDYEVIAEEILLLFSVVGQSEQLKCDHQPKRFDKKHTSCKKCGKILQMKP